MHTINIQPDGSQLSRLVDQAVSGEEIIIARAGKPVARLVPVAQPLSDRRVLGRLAGQLTVPPDFDDPLPEGVLGAFEGR